MFKFLAGVVVAVAGYVGYRHLKEEGRLPLIIPNGDHSEATRTSTDPIGSLDGGEEEAK